jgi:hypothetical protein
MNSKTERAKEAAEDRLRVKAGEQERGKVLQLPVQAVAGAIAAAVVDRTALAIVALSDYEVPAVVVAVVAADRSLAPKRWTRWNWKKKERTWRLRSC